MKGKFRDAEFWVTEEDLDFSRRNQVHEYPLRDLPYVQDMGRKQRQYSLKLTVIGEDYRQARDKLIEALEQPGAGILEYPEIGTIQVSVLTARKSQSTREQGKARFSVTFVEGEDTAPQPAVSSDTAANVVAKADAADEAILNDFTESFETEGLSSVSIADISQDLYTVLADIENSISDVIDPIAELIREPFEMGAAIMDTIGNIRNTLQSPFDALNIYSNFFNSDSSSQASSTTNPTPQQARTQQALSQLVRRTAATSQARIMASIPALRSSSTSTPGSAPGATPVAATTPAATQAFTNSTDALAITNTIQRVIETQLQETDIVNGEPIPDPVYFSLTDLSSALLTDMRIRTAQLPRIIHHTPHATLPALVVAHQLYGDATREQEIVDRNKISNPVFVTGGQALEVLND